MPIRINPKKKKPASFKKSAGGNGGNTLPKSSSSLETRSKARSERQQRRIKAEWKRLGRTPPKKNK